MPPNPASSPAPSCYLPLVLTNLNSWISPKFPADLPTVVHRFRMTRLDPVFSQSHAAAEIL